MSFDVSADAYARFMGRFSEPLATRFVEHVLDERLFDRHLFDQHLVDQHPSAPAGLRALDVGCGPGALTAQLVERLGTEAVAAIDPSPSFVAATRERLPGVDVRSGVAEQLPFPDDCVDLALAELVVHFMTDPAAGLAEMARVTRPGGVVGACVWDHARGDGPLTAFWGAVLDVDPAARDDTRFAGVREADLEGLFHAAGLDDLDATSLAVTAQFAGFDDWWESYTLGVGPAGVYVAQLDDEARSVLRHHCAERLPAGPFEVPAASWCVVARIR